MKYIIKIVTLDLLLQMLPMNTQADNVLFMDEIELGIFQMEKLETLKEKYYDKLINNDYWRSLEIYYSDTLIDTTTLNLLDLGTFTLNAIGENIQKYGKVNDSELFYLKSIEADTAETNPFAKYNLITFQYFEKKNATYEETQASMLNLLLEHNSRTVLVYNILYVIIWENENNEEVRTLLNKFETPLVKCPDMSLFLNAIIENFSNNFEKSYTLLGSINNTEAFQDEYAVAMTSNMLQLAMYDEAIEFLHKYEDYFANEKLIYNLGLAHFNLSNFSIARQLFAEVITISKKEFDLVRYEYLIQYMYTLMNMRYFTEACIFFESLSLNSYSLEEKRELYACGIVAYRLEECFGKADIAQFYYASMLLGDENYLEELMETYQ
jgi:hypothetical protein